MERYLANIPLLRFKICLPPAESTQNVLTRRRKYSQCRITLRNGLSSAEQCFTGRGFAALQVTKKVSHQILYLVQLVCIYTNCKPPKALKMRLQPAGSTQNVFTSRRKHSKCAYHPPKALKICSQAAGSTQNAELLRETDCRTQCLHYLVQSVCIHTNC